MKSVSVMKSVNQFRYLTVTVHIFAVTITPIYFCIKISTVSIEMSRLLTYS